MGVWLLADFCMSLSFWFMFNLRARLSNERSPLRQTIFNLDSFHLYINLYLFVNEIDFPFNAFYKNKLFTYPMIRL